MRQKINFSSFLLIKHLVLGLLIFPFALQALPGDSTRIFTPISGEMPSILKVENSPYIVEADLFISPGETDTIEKGVVLLFNNFTGLHVQGTLYVTGTTEQPVIFTSKNDPFYNPTASIAAAPYDWNGIDIYENAIGTIFENCVVQFSVYGMRSQTEHFQIKNSKFLQNGKSNISIKGNVLTVGTVPFFYGETLVENRPLENGPAVVNKAPTDPLVLHKDNHTFRNILRYSGVVCALSGIAAGIWRSQELIKRRNEYKKISQPSDSNMLNYTTKDWVEARKRYKNEVTTTEICGGIAAIGLITFSISFTF